jgi:hypothetical protein
MKTFDTSSATSSFLLPRLIGSSRANSLLLTGATVSPESPHINALYHEILPTREAVYPAAKAFAQELAASTSQVSIAYAKGLLQHPGDSVEENHLLDSRAMRLLGSSADGAEGVLSFKERRLPKFTGTLSKDSSPWYPWVSAAIAFMFRVLTFLWVLSGRGWTCFIAKRSCKGAQANTINGSTLLFKSQYSR